MNQRTKAKRFNQSIFRIFLGVEKKNDKLQEKKTSEKKQERKNTDEKDKKKQSGAHLGHAQKSLGSRYIYSLNFEL